VLGVAEEEGSEDEEEDARRGEKDENEELNER